MVDQIKIGHFLKELRKEKKLTQSQLAEHFNISDRTISRWETGSNLPDLSLLVELADYYHVDIKEIICGERKSEIMENKEEDTIKLVADYAESEKQNILKRDKLINIISIVVMFLLPLFYVKDLDLTSSFLNNILICIYSFILGILITHLLYITGIVNKIHIQPKRLKQLKIAGIILSCIVIISLIIWILL